MSACVKFLDCGGSWRKEDPRGSSRPQNEGDWKLWYPAPGGQGQALWDGSRFFCLFVFFLVTKAASAGVSPLFRDHLATSQSRHYPSFLCFVFFFPLFSSVVVGRSRSRQLQRSFVMDLRVSWESLNNNSFGLQKVNGNILLMKCELKDIQIIILTIFS